MIATSAARVRGYVVEVSGTMPEFVEAHAASIVIAMDEVMILKIRVMNAAS
jgi:hypothetical protein